MPDSYIDQKTAIMHQLLWTNFLRQYVAVAIPAALSAIPVAGTFLAALFSTSVVQTIVLTVLGNWLYPLFRIMVRFGVFTSIDWQEDSFYAEYEKEATRLLPQLGGKLEKDWTPADEKSFADAADNLIRLHVPGLGSPT